MVAGATFTNVPSGTDGGSIVVAARASSSPGRVGRVASMNVSSSGAAGRSSR